MKILLVEDNAAASATLGMYLEMRGHSVTLAGDGLEGLKALFDETRPPYDGLIVDMVMPNMSGPEMVEKARAAGRLPTNTIAVTGKDRWFMDVPGVRQVFEKPVDPGVIEEALLGAVPPQQ